MWSILSFSQQYRPYLFCNHRLGNRWILKTKVMQTSNSKKICKYVFCYKEKMYVTIAVFDLLTVRSKSSVHIFKQLRTKMMQDHDLNWMENNAVHFAGGNLLFFALFDLTSHKMRHSCVKSNIRAWNKLTSSLTITLFFISDTQTRWKYATGLITAN